MPRVNDAYPLRKTLAANMRRLRAERGMSQEKLAELAGMHRTYVSQVERSEKNISIDNIAKLASVFQITASKLLEEPAGDPRGS